MSRSRSLAALLAAVLLLIAPASAQTFGLGRTATPAEIAGWDIDARGDGAGLPPGRGSVKDGETLYADKCLSCHGDFGEGRDRWPAIAGGAGTLKESDPEKTAGSYWPTAPTLFDYIRRAMPYGGGLTLTPDETYAITAYVLYLNGLLEEDEAIDRDRLAAFRMPNAEGFVRIDDQKPDVVGDPCMTNCREGPVRITSDLARRLEVTPGQHTRRTGLEGAAPRPTAAAATVAQAAPPATPAAATPAPAAATPAPAAATPAAATPAAAPVAAAAPAAGDVEKGRQSYAKCRACHTLEKGGRNLVGPNLHGMFDRKAGAAAGFSFSPAMRDSGLVWTEENVRRYLRAPKDVVPNTKMIFAGIRSDTEMNDLIAYLRAQTK